MKVESSSLATGMSALQQYNHPRIREEATSTRCEGLAGKKMMVPDDGCILGDSLKSLSILDERLEECAARELMSQSIKGKISIDMAFLLRLDNEMDDCAAEHEDDGDLCSCACDSIVITKERRKIKARSSKEESPTE